MTHIDVRGIPCSVRGRRALVRWLVLCLEVFLAGALGTVAPARALGKDSVKDGRAAAQRAGQFAADGRCGDALPLYDKAFRILKDPAILFNRAECLLKVGRTEDALRDYRRFLEDMPKAPNRALVEERIASLSRAAAVPDATAPPGPPPSVPTVVVEPVPPPAALPGAQDLSPRPAALPSAASASQIPPAPAAEVGPVPDLYGGLDRPLMPDLDDERDGESALGARLEPEEGARSGTSPWLWVGAAVVVAAAAVAGAVLLFGGDETRVPRTSLGNYRF